MCGVARRFNRFDSSEMHIATPSNYLLTNVSVIIAICKNQIHHILIEIYVKIVLKLMQWPTVDVITVNYLKLDKLFLIE